MKYGQLILSDKDFELLETILLNWSRTSELSKVNYLRLKEELKKAKIVTEDKMPKDVVRFKSVVSVETPFGVLDSYQLVVPAERDPRNKKMSILSPVGSAIIGYAEGDDVFWDFPIGERKIIIKAVQNLSESTSGVVR